MRSGTHPPTNDLATQYKYRSPTPEEIRNLLTRHGITAYRASQKLGVCDSTISRPLRGDGKMSPQLWRLLKLLTGEEALT